MTFRLRASRNMTLRLRGYRIVMFKLRIGRVAMLMAEALPQSGGLAGRGLPVTTVRPNRGAGLAWGQPGYAETARLPGDGLAVRRRAVKTVQTAGLSEDGWAERGLAVRGRPGCEETAGLRGASVAVKKRFGCEPTAWL